MRSKSLMIHSNKDKTDPFPFRILIYLMLRKADRVLKKLTENEATNLFSDRRILSYGK